MTFTEQEAQAFLWGGIGLGVLGTLAFQTLLKAAFYGIDKLAAYAKRRARTTKEG